MKEMTFSTHRIEVTLPSVANGEITIIPVGDIHRETPNCDVDRWKGFLKKLKKELSPTTFLLGTGDWNDFVSTSERAKLKHANLHETTVSALDEGALKSCTRLLDELWFTKGHWLGMVNGNHHWDFTTPACEGIDGKTSDEYMADRLGCRHLGDLAYIRLSVGFARTAKRTVIDIVVHHGTAGGKLAGTSINQVDNLRTLFPRADIYIMGHDHRKMAVPVTSLKVDGYEEELKVKQHRQWLCRSGSFLRGYVPDKQSYVVKALYRPNDLGIVKLHCGFKSRHGGYLDKDIHVWY